MSHSNDSFNNTCNGFECCTETAVLPLNSMIELNGWTSAYNVKTHTPLNVVLSFQ